MDMREKFKERTVLANAYVLEGAYRSAARVLEELAAEVREHANKVHGREPLTAKCSA